MWEQYSKTTTILRIINFCAQLNDNTASKIISLLTLILISTNFSYEITKIHN